jgi:predicted metal-binding membrane protein
VSDSNLDQTGTFDRQIEATVRHDRRVVAASLVLIVALAWLYLWRDAAMMADMADMPMPAAGSFGMTFVMWAVMMVGMMLPSAAPAILLYAAMVRRNGERGTVLPAVWIFTGGYLAVWAAFSLAAALLQLALEHAALLTPQMSAANNVLGAAILLVAGVYQWLPIKNVCLSRCRNPLQFFVTRWRSGALGAWRMGIDHGTYCIGCCWALMLLLFVAGVMNLLWVALIAAFVFVEKLLPAARFTSHFAGGALIVAAVALLLAG